MRKKLIKYLIWVSLPVVVMAATPAEEKAFVASYRKALESGNEAALKKMFYTDGNPAAAEQMVAMVLQAHNGRKIAKVAMEKLSEEELRMFQNPVALADGRKFKMPVMPEKQLVVTYEKKGKVGTGVSVSKCPVAEKDGVLVFPVPVLVQNE